VFIWYGNEQKHNLLILQAYIQEGQLDARMLSALLTGINRAFPFIKSMYLPIGNYGIKHIVAI